QSTRRPDDSRTEWRRAPTCRAACHDASILGEKLVYLGWAKLSFRSTAASVPQGTILTGNTPEFLEYFRSARDPTALRRRSSAGISCAGNDRRPTRFAAQRLATKVKRPGAVSSVVERLVYTDTQLIFSFYPTCSGVLGAR